MITGIVAALEGVAFQSDFAEALRRPLLCCKCRGGSAYDCSVNS